MDINQRLTEELDVKRWQKNLESVRLRFVILSRSLRNRRVIRVMRCQSQSFAQMSLR